MGRCFFPGLWFLPGLNGTWFTCFGKGRQAIVSSTFSVNPAFFCSPMESPFSS